MVEMEAMGILTMSRLYRVAVAARAAPEDMAPVEGSEATVGMRALYGLSIVQQDQIMLSAPIGLLLVARQAWGAPERIPKVLQGLMGLWVRLRTFAPVIHAGQVMGL